MLTNHPTMCVIIIKQQGKQLPKEVAKNSANINPHGLGIIWLDTYEVSFHKSNQYRLLNTDRPFIAHFRYATVGVVGKENTHPFVCGKKANEWLMMNGTIKNLGNDKESDSKVLARSLGDIPRQAWKQELEKHECRFVTVNTRNKTYQVYNRAMWTQKDGIWYSKDNVLQDNIVAVYGTLKMGYSNYWHYLSKAKYVASGKTLDKYPLLIKGLPYLIDEAHRGHNVEVDVFAVSDTQLQDLDRLEGHPNWYQRRQVPIKVRGKVMNCWVYFNIKEKASNDSVLHKSYVQSYKPSKSWIDYEVPAKVTKPMFVFDDEDVCEFSVVNEKPLCIDCYQDLEHDMFANYHCNSCDGWFTEADVIKFNNL